MPPRSSAIRCKAMRSFSPPIHQTPSPIVSAPCWRPAAKPSLGGEPAASIRRTPIGPICTVIRAARTCSTRAGALRLWRLPRSRRLHSRPLITTCRHRLRPRSSTSIARCWSSAIPCSTSYRRRPSSSWRRRQPISSSRRRHHHRTNCSCYRFPCLCRSRFGSIRLPMWRRPQVTLSSITSTTRPSSTTMPTSSLRARRGRPGLAPPGWRPVLQLARRPARSPRKSLCPHPWPARHQRLEARQLRGRPPGAGPAGAAGVPVPGSGAKPGTPPAGTLGAPAAHLPPGHELPGASGPCPWARRKAGDGHLPVHRARQPRTCRQATNCRAHLGLSLGQAQSRGRHLPVTGRASRALAARPRIAGRIWACPWARRKAGDATCRCTGRASRTLAARSPTARRRWQAIAGGASESAGRRPARGANLAQRPRASSRDWRRERRPKRREAWPNHATRCDGAGGAATTKYTAHRPEPAPKPSRASKGQRQACDYRAWSRHHAETATAAADLSAAVSAAAADLSAAASTAAGSTAAPTPAKSAA